MNTKTNRGVSKFWRGVDQRREGTERAARPAVFLITVGGERRTVEGTYRDALDLKRHMEASPTAVAGTIEELS